MGHKEEVAFHIPSGDCIVYAKSWNRKASNSVGFKVGPDQTVRLRACYTGGAPAILLMREQSQHTAVDQEGVGLVN